MQCECFERHNRYIISILNKELKNNLKNYNIRNRDY